MAISKADAAELILLNNNPWVDCDTCKGVGKIFQRAKRLRSVTGETDVTENIYKKCPSCSGQGRYMPRAYKQAYKKLGMKRPDHPGPVKAILPQFRKALPDDP
jgi:hypothetical protein